MKLRTPVFVVLLAFLGTLLGAGPASAVDITRITAVPASGKVSCYGYTGTFRQGTDVIEVDWDTASNECWGIATDRTIWHAWPGSGGWKRMGGNGHADRVVGWMEWNGDKSRRVQVWVASNNSYWCQLYYLPGGWQGFWFQC